MASRETSRTLGCGQRRVRWAEASASEDAEDRGQGPSEAVQAGAGSGARSAVESTVLDGANKRQRTDELSTGHSTTQHQPETMLHHKIHHRTVRPRPASLIPVQEISSAPIMC